MRIAIQGIGVTGGFGNGVAGLKDALITGECMPDTVPVNADNGSIGISGGMPGEMPVFTADTAGLKSFVSPRLLRRVDHYSRMALYGSFLALKDAGDPELDRKRLGIVIATGYGAMRTTFLFLDSVMETGEDQHASPIRFSNSVHNAAAAHISILLNARGPALTVSQFEMSFPSALVTACQWLAEKRVDAVLVGGVDEYCDVLGYCRQRFFGNSRCPAIEPFEFDKQTAIAGEGAAFFLLSLDTVNGSGYGYIEDVRMGNIAREAVPDNACLFTGADGHKKCGNAYKQYLDKTMPVASYAPVYGSFPTATALDMAVAGISMKTGRMFASPETSNSDSNLNIIKTEQSRSDRKIGCLKISDRGEYSLIVLGKD